MAAAKPKTLFISHDASRTGAPRVLLHLLTWLRTNLDFPFVVLLGRRGPLQPHFEALAPTYVWDGAAARVPRHLVSMLRRTAAVSAIKRHGCDLIYANSAASSRILRDLRTAFQVPAICHVHELEWGIERFVGRELFSETVPHVAHFIAVSEATRKMLTDAYDISRDRVDLEYEFVPVSSLRGIDVQTVGAKTRLICGIPPGAFVVGGAGTLDWRKGVDLFVEVARLVRERTSDVDIHFVWVGASDSMERTQVVHDVRKIGLTDRFHLIDSVNDPAPYFCLMDAFALTSREDPFPLVCLEAAALGKPIGCFAESGGMPEFVSDRVGFVVPYHATDAFADRLALLASDPSRARAMGAAAASEVRRFDVAVSAPRIARRIERVAEMATG